MSSRLARLAAAAGTTIALCLVASCGTSAPPSPPAPAASVGTALDGVVPASIRSLRLTDSEGHTTTLGAFRGKTLVISDSMALCTEDCPLDTANIVSAARATDAAGLTHRVEFLTISVDPGRDTPRRLTAYRRFYATPTALPNWKLLTGTRANITRLWKYLGVFWQRVPEGSPPDQDWLTGKPLTYDVAHADEVLLFDGHGHERFVISGHAHVPKTGQVPARMRAFLNAQGHQHLYQPGQDAWTPDDVLQAVSWLVGRRVTAS